MKKLPIAYVLLLIGCGKFQKDAEQSVSVQSFSIEESVVLEKPTKLSEIVNTPHDGKISGWIKELIITESGELNLEGRSVEIKIGNFASYNGSIVGPNQDPGSSSGDIIIVTNTASGTLNLNLSGIAGKDGFNGAEGKYKDDSPKGTAILNGNNGIEVYEMYGLSSSKFACKKQPEDGKTPTPINGENGRDGGNGGSSASGRLTVIQNTEMEINIVNEAGLGGAGGKGGKAIAMPAGIGGFIIREQSKIGISKEISNGAKQGRCTPAKNGKIGLKGSDGVPGINGTPGTKNHFCVSKNKQSKCI